MSGIQLNLNAHQLIVIGEALNDERNHLTNILNDYDKGLIVDTEDDTFTRSYHAERYDAVNQVMDMIDEIRKDWPF